MNRTEKNLEKETKKWLEKLEKEFVGVKSTGKIDAASVNNAMENIRAYMNDCRHFLKEKDFVRAFEAIVYAWGIYETALRAGLIER